MKRILIAICALAAVISVGSCQNEEEYLVRETDVVRFDTPRENNRKITLRCLGAWKTVVPEGYAPFAPFLIEIPIDGNVWLAEACPDLDPLVTDNPQTGDHPAPIIAAMTLVLSIFAVFTLSDKYKK